jgi:hypothetical protein
MHTDKKRGRPTEHIERGGWSTVSGGAQNPKALDGHYETIRIAMQAVFHELGLAA